MKKKISIVCPALNEEKNLPLLCQRIQQVISSTPHDYEIVIADNGSSDNSITVLKEIQKKQPQVKILELTRNFGHQGGILAGLANATGNAVITMDADLQHPPETIAPMIKLWEQGFMVVNSEKENSHSTPFRKFMDKLFYSLMEHYADLEFGHSDFRLLDRQVLDKFNSLPETEKFMRGLISWLGFKTAIVKYKVGDRMYGVSKYTAKQLWDLALNGITSFSLAPLRMMFTFGVMIFIPSFFYLVYLLTLSFLIDYFKMDFKFPPGWATITVTIIFFGSVQMLSIGILGEYIGRIYSEVKRRPKFIIKDSD